MSEPNSQTELLEKLLLGLLVIPGDPRGSEPRLFVGQIPESLPVPVPVPEQARVLGTLARSEANVEIVLETDLTREDLLAFYRAELGARGWQEAEDLGRPAIGGFLQSNYDRYASVIFCQQQSGAGLTLYPVRPGTGSSTTVHLTLNLDRALNPCAHRTLHSGWPRHHFPHDIIPPLAPPPGARHRPGRGSASSTEVSVTAVLSTTLAIEDLAQHYTGQLSEAGWTQTDGETSGPLAWSTWRFPREEPWTAVFFALRTPEKAGEYFLYVRATVSAPEDQLTFSGWMT